MSDSDLIVPVEVHALLVNQTVRTQHPFYRAKPSFERMLGTNRGRAAAEPEPFQEGKTPGAAFEGVHVQWQLPEALTDGYIDEATGETRFPLVPNRWLVVRYAEVAARTTTAGWIVHSDYLYSDDDGANYDGITENSFLAPDADNPEEDWIGRLHKLSAGPWTEPAERELFLTAVGSGLPNFAAYEPYHENVFSMHDTLADLKDAGSLPAAASLSYLVVGWYSDSRGDILRTAAAIPGLLPPGSDGSVADVIAALGWATAADTAAVTRSVFSGTALGLAWSYPNPAPVDDRPGGNPLKIALGHSTGEAATALVDRQTGDADTAQLFGALYHGTLETFDGAEGDEDLAETTHRSWFSGSDAEYSWQIRPRPGSTGDDAPAVRSADLTPAWLGRLNADQAEHDAALPVLADQQWRLWSLYWLANLPPVQRPPDLPAEFDAYAASQLSLDNETGLAHATQAQLDAVSALEAELPAIAPGDPDPQAAIDAFAAERGLPGHLQLARVPGDSYYKPADPVLLIEGSAGAVRPLTRDHDNPLPCRTPGTLLRRVLIGADWTSPPPEPPDPGTGNLPGPCAALLAEFALLDLAARTTDAAGDSALTVVVASPDTHAEGSLAEYTGLWRQAWLPMTLMWKLNFFFTPYRTGDNDYHWTFQAPEDGTPDSYSYSWNGTGAPPEDFESEGHLLNRLFRARAYLAPTTVFVARAQLARYLTTFPDADAAALGSLREELQGLDVLSQTLDGFNDWLLQLDGGAQVTTEADIADLIGEQDFVPDGAAARRDHRFDPVRAGQFTFTDLRIVDRFGRVVDLVTSGEGGTVYDQYPVRTSSVTPSHDLYEDVVNPERFIQLPPRLLQDTRLAFTPRTGSTTRAADTPVAGWLLVNYLDQTLALYGPVGEALGELRVVENVRGTRSTEYTVLPHAAYSGQNDPRFTEDHPHLSEFLDALLGRTPDDFADLVATIDKSLCAVVDPVPSDDQLPSRLIGRPVALIRTDLDLQLQGPVLTDPSWSETLQPTDQDYPDYTWAIRLGDPYNLDDGLIGYFGAAPEQPVDYDLFHAVDPVIGSTSGSTGPAGAAAPGRYIQPIGNGEDLALPARPSTDPLTRHLTLLAHPHLPVHATTGILPVHDLRLDPDLVHHALAEIRASFRLNPLLATTRDNRTASSSIPGHGDDSPAAGPVERILDGREDTWFQTGDADGRSPAVRAGDWVQVDLGEEKQVTQVQLELGEPDSGRTAPAKKLQASVEGTVWTDLGSATATATGLSWPQAGSDVPAPLSARFLRIHFTEDSPDATVVRNVRITAAPADGALVVPPLSARFGTWSWAQPQATDSDLPGWDARSLIPADQLSHPEDAVPTARAGYLQLRPAADDPLPDPVPDPEP